MNSHASRDKFTGTAVRTAVAFAYRDIIGIDVADLTLDEALTFVNARIENAVHTKISFLNAHNANVAKTDAGFRAALEKFTLFPDGVGVDIAAKLLQGRKFKANLNGTDFIPALLQSAKKPVKVGLYGAAPDVVIKTAEAFSKLNPENDVRVLGHGFINEIEQTTMLAEMERWHPDVLLVALGVPKQELWIADHLTQKHCSLAFGIGALFDFAAGNVPRAPQWVRAIRLEWAYRLINEPVRLARRYLLGNPLFLTRVIAYKFASKSASSGSQNV
ncbi:MAG: WecB/TagA/CpsF family glycosyltransferase [Ahrensia sp.]|nr:WecB/TagA/CpsF family glycosyltransferase [Ahrensia sp.]